MSNDNNDMTWTYDIGGWPTASGAHAGFAVDCERRLVYSYGAVGAGVPEAVFHGDHPSFPHDVRVVPDSLDAWLRDNEDLWEALDMAREDDHEYGEALEAVDRAWEDRPEGAIQITSDPNDYTRGAWSEIVGEVADFETVREHAEALVEDAAEHGVILDLDETIATCEVAWGEYEDDEEVAELPDLTIVYGRVPADGRWIAAVEDIPGCHVYGTDRALARRAVIALALDVIENLVVVEVMPRSVRGSHEAAGYGGLPVGRYPGNGADRICVSREIADIVIQREGAWVRVVGDATPADIADYGMTKFADTIPCF